MSNPREPGVQSVAHAVQLVSVLAEAGTDVGVHELARLTKLHVTTVHRLLRTLVSVGLVEQRPESARYCLGPVVLSWAEAYSAHAELRHVARRTLEGLAMESRETVHLMVRRGFEGVYVDRADSPQRLKVTTPVGHREPLHGSAVGKALLAFLPDGLRAEILGRGLAALTEHTIGDVRALQAQLRSIRAQGYAVDLEEGEIGVRCVGAPIFGRDGMVAGALSVAAPVSRLPESEIVPLSAAVRAAAEDVSRRLGHTGGSKPAPGSPQGAAGRADGLL